MRFFIITIAFITFLYPNIDHISQWECYSDDSFNHLNQNTQTTQRELEKAVVRAKIF